MLIRLIKVIPDLFEYIIFEEGQLQLMPEILDELLVVGNYENILRTGQLFKSIKMKIFVDPFGPFMGPQVPILGPKWAIYCSINISRKGTTSKWVDNLQR